MTPLICKPYSYLATLAATLIVAVPALTFAQAVPGGAQNFVNNPNTTILDEPPPEGGWDALANLLNAAKPSTNTNLQPSPAQWTDHFERLLNAGKNEQALAEIEKRLASQQTQSKLNGTDVQLEFQHARALAAVGRHQDALDIYSKMTTLYPELPEPWNNLAVLQAANGDLEQASQSLQMALRANPQYTAARANLGDIQLKMAQESYRQAGKPFPGNTSAPSSPKEQ